MNFGVIWLIALASVFLLMLVADLFYLLCRIVVKHREKAPISEVTEDTEIEDKQ